ncbi:hypothetical protein B0T25DRAFT_558804 [Lasiosphaeria hispida]|uniref:Uncharacterized protein n=1 Tax=Lasiosphaeria hispida TaxID=260671 RepID=A0AAJ0H6N4_9PEZI|nr:hypothetical protein B0T25DRAFT_558804 [Lasiosphaeria hispida]
MPAILVPSVSSWILCGPGSKSPTWWGTRPRWHPNAENLSWAARRANIPCSYTVSTVRHSSIREGPLNPQPRRASSPGRRHHRRTHWSLSAVSAARMAGRYVPTWMDQSHKMVLVNILQFTSRCYPWPFIMLRRPAKAGPMLMAALRSTPLRRCSRAPLCCPLARPGVTPSALVRWDPIILCLGEKREAPHLPHLKGQIPNTPSATLQERRPPTYCAVYADGARFAGSWKHFLFGCRPVLVRELPN